MWGGLANQWLQIQHGPLFYISICRHLNLDLGQIFFHFDYRFFHVHHLHYPSGRRYWSRSIRMDEYGMLDRFQQPPIAERLQMVFQ
jgi:hypothetical protein